MNNRTYAPSPSSALIVVVPLLAILVGIGIGSGSNLPLAFAGATLIAAPLLQSPATGLVLAWGLYFLVPPDALPFPIPVMDSLLMVVASGTLLSGILRTLNYDESFPSSSAYAPILLWVGLWIIWLATGYGNDISREFEWTIKGMWPLAVVVFTVRTPHHAAAVLLSFSAFALVMILKDFPVDTILDRVQLASGQAVPQVTRDYGSIQSVQISALIWPLFASVGLTASVGRTLRLLAIIGATVLFASVLASGYAMPYVTLFTGFATIMTIKFLNRKPGDSFLFPALLGVVLLFLLLNSVGAVSQIERLENPEEDASGEVRIQKIETNIEGFLKRPVLGWGVWSPENTPSGTYRAGNHHAVTDLAVKFGLVGLLSFFAMLSAIGLTMYRLLQQDLVPLDRAVVRGIFGSFVSYVVAGFVSVSIGHISWDTVFWFFVGLTITWSYWLTHETHETLLPQQQPVENRQVYGYRR